MDLAKVHNVSIKLWDFFLVGFVDAPHVCFEQSAHCHLHKYKGKIQIVYIHFVL